MNSFNRIKEKNYLLKNIFTALERMEKIGDDGKVSDGHISVKDYLMCEKTWNNLGLLSRSLIEKRYHVISRYFQKVYCYVLKIVWT